MCEMCTGGKTIDDVMMTVADRIAKYGWTTVAVYDGPYIFIYTVGLTELDHPELLLRGKLPLDVMHSIVGRLAQEVVDGRRLTSGEVIPDYLAPGMGVKLYGPTSSTEAEAFIAKDVYGAGPEDVQVLQVLWPDDAGRFPDDPLFSERWVETQPLVSRAA